jgi:Tol biopolymer transport system component
LWRIGIGGADLKRLTHGTEDSSPSFSPDGKWIVFSRYAGRWETLWKVSSEGGEATQLTDKLSKYPVVSPDGKFIACYYWDHQKGPSVQLAILEFDAGKLVKAFDTAALTILSPVEYRWTPDGRAITYVVTTKGTSNIWSQEIAGGSPRQITSFKSDRILSFDWSRDGKQLVFSRGTRSSDVVLMTDLR